MKLAVKATITSWEKSWKCFVDGDPRSAINFSSTVGDRIRLKNFFNEFNSQSSCRFLFESEIFCLSFDSRSLLMFSILNCSQSRFPDFSFDDEIFTSTKCFARNILVQNRKSSSGKFSQKLSHWPKCLLSFDCPKPHSKLQSVFFVWPHRSRWHKNTKNLPKRSISVMRATIKSWGRKNFSLHCRHKCNSIESNERMAESGIK